MRFYLLGLAAWMLLLDGCANEVGNDSETMPGYDLGAGEKYNMPESLLEISGITFSPHSADTIYAVQDEQGRVFHFGWKDKQHKGNTKFGKGGDYEDISVMRETVYILKSNGTIYSFPLADIHYQELDSVKEVKGLLPKGEYEGMYADETEGKLYIICKNCEGNKNKETVSGYILQGAENLENAGSFEIDVESIKPFSGRVKKGFRPSGLARNPLTGEWFIISGVNKLLVVTDHQWKVKGAYHLHGNRFNQPEGITFDRFGNLYISNEGDDFSDGNILKFARIGDR